MGGLTVFLAVGPFFMPGDHEKRGGDSIVTVLIGQEIYTKSFWLKKMGLVYEERFPSLNRECLEALKTPLGLFGKRTVVVEAQSLSKGFKELPWAMEKAQNDLVLVLTEYGSTKEAKKLQGLLERAAKVKECHQLTPQQFKTFVFRSLKALGEEKGAADGCAHELRITEKAYAAFAERTGYLRRPERGASTSLYPVIGYLRSLAFLDTDDIEERHVTAVVPLDTEGGTREMVRALFTGNTSGFMEAASKQKGQEVQALSYLMAPFEKMAAARAAGARNAHEAGMRDWEWNQALFNLPEKELYAACALLKETHDGIKGGYVSPDAGFTVAMGKLAYSFRKGGAALL